GHKDFTTGIYTFTVVFTRSASNHSQIMQFPDTGNGFQLPIKFGTNQTSLREPSVARYVFVNCNTKSSHNLPSAASIEYNFVSSPSQDFQCFRSSRWPQEEWYFKSTPYRFGQTQTLLGYGLYFGKVYNHGGGFYDGNHRVYN